MQLQIVRVADSFGEIYFEDFIVQSLTPEEIQILTQSVKERIDQL